MRLVPFLLLQGAFAAGAAAFAGCVIPIGDQSTLDGGTPTGEGGTSTTDSGTTPDDAAPPFDGATVDGGWVFATSNLVGLPSGCGNLGFISAKPDEDLVIVAIDNQGFFASAKGATEWSSLGTSSDGGLDEGGGERIENSASQFVYDPAHTQTYWEAGNHGPCAYVTTNDGNSYDVLGGEVGCDSIAVDFADPARQTLLAGGHETHSVFRSTNGGTTWTDVGPNLPAAAGFTGWVVLLTPQIHLVGSYEGTGEGIFRTTDGGNTWTQVYAGGIRSPALITTDAIYWVLDQENGDQGVLKSTDQGVTWTKLPASGSVITSETGVLVLPGGLLATAGSSGLLVSPDEGASWSSVGPAFPWTPAGVAYSTFRKQFFIWQWQCAAGANPIPANDIAALDVSFP